MQRISGHLAVAGSVLALYYGGLALAVAALTDRRAYAAGGYLGLLLVSSAASAIVHAACILPAISGSRCST